jgi:hypothetical protein
MSFTIRFHDGEQIAESATTADDMTRLAQLLEAKAQGRDDLTITKDNDPARTVADIQSIKVKAEWSWER